MFSNQTFDHLRLVIYHFLIFADKYFHINRLVFQQYTYLIIHVTLFPQDAWFSFHPMALAQAEMISKDYSNYIE